MFYRYLATLLASVLVGCISGPSVDYTDEYSRASDANRAVQNTQEAMATDDVLGSLSAMLGAPDQTGTVPASNVRFVHNIDELNEMTYRRYTLRVADNMHINHTSRRGYDKDFDRDLEPRGYDKDFDRGYDKDRYSKGRAESSVRMRLEDAKEQYPNAVVAINKQDKIIAVASDSLEAQALAQKSPRVFYVLKGQTLKQTVSRWSKQADWSMRWSIQRDYTMVAPATIFGEFSAQGGSLDQLLGTLRHLDQPLKAQFARNKVVVIRENTYNSSIMAVMP